MSDYATLLYLKRTKKNNKNDILHLGTFRNLKL